MARHPKNARMSQGGKRKRRSEISSISPVSSSTENNKSYSRRVGQSNYAEVRRKKERRRKRLITAGVLSLVLVLGAVGAAWAYVGNISSNFKPTEAAMNKLTPTAKPEDPFYMLLMGQDARPGEKQARTDSLILAYVNPPLKKVTLISIPRDSRVKIPGHGLNKINAASSFGGPELTIETVSDFAGVDISQYAQVDFSGFKEIIDSVGGITVDVPTRIADRQAGPVTIEKGVQKLNGVAALTFSRTRHSFATGDFQRVKNQQIVLKALAKEIFAIRSPLKAAEVLTKISKATKTSLSLSDITKLMKSFEGMDIESIETVTVPAGTSTIDGVSYVIVDDAAWQAMMERIKAGQPADAEKAAAQDANTVKASDPSTIGVTVRNGAGVSGIATEAADKLTKKGYVIKETGNTSQFVYDETLVIYNEGKEADAKAIATTLGMGKCVPSQGRYTFTGDILVVVGKDWKP